LNAADEDRGPLPEEIVLSWQRSEINGVDPNMTIDGAPLGDVDPDSRLLVAARPVLDEMDQDLSGTRFSLVLADQQGHLADMRFGDQHILSTLARTGAAPGRRFVEETTGNNAIATALELRRGVAVRGAEHYVAALRRFSCYGVPIIHPATRRVAGVLDITGLAEDDNSLLGPYLAQAVREIERRLLEGAREAHRRMLAEFEVRAVRRLHPVLVLGDDLTLANHAAVDVLDSADYAILRGIAADLASDRELAEDLTLVSGQRVRARLRRVGGTSDGVLFELETVDQGIPPAPGEPHDPGLHADGLECQLHRCRERQVDVLLTGEPGTGFSWATEILLDGRPVEYHDAAAVLLMGERDWLARLREVRGVLLVKRLHLLSPGMAVEVGRLLEERTDWTVATSAPLAELTGETARLASRFMTRVELPPLRRRREELPRIVRSMLVRLGANLRFTPATLEALAAQPWPGNLRELETVVQWVAERRSVGDVTVLDLPPAYQSAPRRRLNPLEQAEYDAIRAALIACDGNKVQAAQRLGISRATLYNRIRALGISF
jgi:transcriptional regulator of acetoin/glycerol metabolism